MYLPNQYAKSFFVKDTFVIMHSKFILWIFSKSEAERREANYKYDSNDYTINQEVFIMP